MKDKRKIDQLVEALTEGGLTRRAFIKKSTALGLPFFAAFSIAGPPG